VSSLLAVLRCNGERTENIAWQRLEAPEKRRISVSPFEDAVRVCFDLALESGAEWLMVADADVLTADGAIQALQRHAQRCAEDVWHFQGRIHCKLYMGEREGGHRMYRVSHLYKARALIRRAQRVESDLLKRYPAKSEKIGLVTGRHDFQQWFRDIHRKAAAHRQKHRGWRKLVKTWEASGDPDLEVAALGWRGLPLDRPEKEPLQ
jgi:hypothetical protein